MISIYGLDGIIKSVFYGPQGVLPFMDIGDQCIEGFGEPGIDRVVMGVVVQGTKSKEALLFDLRAKRNRKLAETDWVVTKAQELGQAVPLNWSAYRQALRDITLQTDLWAIEWPDVPQA